MGKASDRASPHDGDDGPPSSYHHHLLLLSCSRADFFVRPFGQENERAEWAGQTFLPAPQLLPPTPLDPPPFYSLSSTFASLPAASPLSSLLLSYLPPPPSPISTMQGWAPPPRPLSAWVSYFTPSTIVVVVPLSSSLSFIKSETAEWALQAREWGTHKQSLEWKGGRRRLSLDRSFHPPSSLHFHPPFFASGQKRRNHGSFHHALFLSLRTDGRTDAHGSFLFSAGRV